MNSILLFVIPPVAGAFIGYVTNVIAIRMLFRPLNEKRIFGIRLPFTPGILPRKRKNLAANIGSMVERELLTATIIRERLSREDVQEKLKSSISFFTANILENTPKKLSSGSEKILAEKIPSVLEKVYPVFSAAIMEFLNQADIRREIESKGRVILRSIILKLNTFQRFVLSAGQYDQTLDEKMPEIINDLTSGIKNILQEDRVKNSIVGTVSNSLKVMIGEDTKIINDILEISANDKIKLDNYILEKLTTAVDRQIENILSSINIKTLVSDRIDSLDMLKVERIILDVLSNQLKYVELFGGILGFLMGMFQAALTYFLN